MVYTNNQKFFSSIESDEFLPPISRWTSLAGISLMGTVSAGISLASFVKYNVTVKATSVVRPTGEIRLVQPSIDGQVKTIFVKENQIVKRGDAIARLDDLELHIKNSQLVVNIQGENLQLAQINAQIKALDNQVDAEKKVIEQTISSAKADLSHNKWEYQLQRIKAQSESLLAQANLQKAQVDLQKVQVDLEFANRERDRYSTLVKEGAIAQRQLDEKQLIVMQAKSAVEVEQTAVDIAKANRKTAKAALNPSGATVNIALSKIAQESAKGESSIAAFIREKNALIQRKIEMLNQIRQSQKEIQKNNIQIQHSVIPATSDGIILKLNLRNPGQVVHTSESIAEIVPENTPLVIKAMVPAADIKNVEVGQNVQLRVNACPYPDYGTLNGIVSTISPDAITPQTNNASATTPVVNYFEVSIKPENLSFGNGKRNCRIQAGMDATSDIISKQETAMQFLLRKARLITDL